MRYQDFRDAAILWLLANIAGLITTGLIVVAYHVDQPLSIAVNIASVTGAIATAALIIAAIGSMVVGVISLKDGDHA